MPKELKIAVVVIIAVFLATTIIPALLSAASDLAVLVGVGLVLAGAYGIYALWRHITTFVCQDGTNFTSDSDSDSDW